MEFDILIKNGKVLDGNGDPTPFRPWLELDIGIKDGRIAAVENNLDGDALQTIDATDLMVMPGIIDVHSHSDLYLLENPKAESSIRQGITTVVVGNCGMSAAPIYNDYRPASSIFPGKIEYAWETMEEYLSKIESIGLSVNLVAMAGHCNIRAAGMAYEKGCPSPEAMATMKRVLQESLDAGAWGMSTGLIYPPGYFADQTELIELLNVVAENNCVHHSHIRGQGETLIAAVQEMIHVSESAGSPLHILHHKGMGDANAPKVMVTLQMVEEAIARGVDVTLDMYPYQVGQGGLAMFLPHWVHEGGSLALVKRLQDYTLRRQIVREMLEPSLLPGYQSYVRDLGPKVWDNIIICECQLEKNHGLAGKSINAARKTGQDPLNFVFDLLVEESGDVPVVIPDVIELDDTYLQRVLRNPATIFGSDGYALAPYGLLGQGKPHPRSYGTFPRILGQYVRERRLFSWHEAVRKMTSLPAQHMGIKDRGCLSKGMWADIMLFDPDSIIDQATIENPHQYPLGIHYVINNGTIVVEGERHTGEFPGRVLRRT